MHIKVKNRTAIIEFESGGLGDTIDHRSITAELIHLLEHNFKSFIFDFTGVNIEFNSSISGFIVSTVKKLSENNADITIQNISENDYRLLNMAGLASFNIKYKTI